MVVRIITTTKDIRKKGNRYEIEKDGIYILLKKEDNLLLVINAKKN